MNLKREKIQDNQMISSSFSTRLTLNEVKFDNTLIKYIEEKSGNFEILELIQKNSNKRESSLIFKTILANRRAIKKYKVTNRINSIHDKYTEALKKLGYKMILINDYKDQLFDENKYMNDDHSTFAEAINKFSDKITINIINNRDNDNDRDNNRNDIENNNENRANNRNSELTEENFDQQDNINNQNLMVENNEDSLINELQIKIEQEHYKFNLKVENFIFNKYWYN